MNLGDEHDYNALFLADVLERSAQSHTQANAAAEMRRLHAELERCKQVCAATAEGWRSDAEEWKAQRDALLEALKMIDKEFQKHGRQHWPEAVKARAAIAKAEENT